jgi:hypothetical protein
MSGIVEFFKKAGHDIKAAAEKLGHVFVAIFGKDATKQLIEAAQKILASDFGKIILATVDGLMTVKAASGAAAARTQAFDEIKTASVGAGLDLKDSLINLLIELAVNKANGTLKTLSAVSG